MHADRKLVNRVRPVLGTDMLYHRPLQSSQLPLRKKLIYLIKNEYLQK